MSPLSIWLNLLITIATEAVPHRCEALVHDDQYSVLPVEGVIKKIRTETARFAAVYKFLRLFVGGRLTRL